MNIENFLNPESIYRIVISDVENKVSALGELIKECSTPEEVYEIYRRGKLSLSAVNYKAITHYDWASLKIPISNHPIYIFLNKFTMKEANHFIETFYGSLDNWLYLIYLASI